MEIGTGIAITGTSFAVAATVINLLKKTPEKATCALHDLAMKQLDELKEWLRRVEGKIDQVIRDRR
jgi:hypothetical protein